MTTLKEKIEKLDADLARITTEREALVTASADAASRIEAAAGAAKQARVADTIESTAATKKAARVATEELERLVESESAAIERERLLGEAIASLQAQRERLERQIEIEENQRRRAARAALIPNLEREVARLAPAAQNFAAAVLALSAARGMPVQDLPLALSEWLGGRHIHSGLHAVNPAHGQVRAQADALLAKLEAGEALR
jgi:chromosome segregation ATPase